MRELLERDLFRIELMIENIYGLQDDLKKLARHNIPVEDEMSIKLLAFSLGQIGEQCSFARMSEETREKFSNIDWKEITDFRNGVNHEYHNMNNAVILDNALRKAPLLLTELEEVRGYLLSELRKREEE